MANRSLLGLMTSLYRRLLYASMRNFPLVNKLTARLLPHNVIYGLYYYGLVEGSAVGSAAAISESIISDLKPRAVIDVGCGTGALLAELRNKGCEVLGLEYSEAALNACRAQQIVARKFDLDGDAFQDDTTFDVAVSLEVAEHLPEQSANRYIDLLTRLSEVVVFSAAPPGQGGAGHLNEQPPAYWNSKFRSRGFEQDKELSRRWREKWESSGVTNYYYNNLMIFRQIREN